MPKHAVLVRYGIKPGRMNDLMAVLRDHIAKTRASEPGCVQFDVLIPHDEADTVRLYEVYANEEAFDQHNKSEQLARYRKESEPLLLDRNIVWCTVDD